MTLQFDIFLQENNIAIHQLPEEIQKPMGKVRALYKSIRDLPDGEEKQRLRETIEELDIDILQHIEKHFEEQLTNNDVIGKQFQPEQKRKVKLEKTDPDQQIIERLIAIGYTKGIDRSTFHQIGLTHDLTRTTRIGKHTLKRVSLTRYTFDII